MRHISDHLERTIAQALNYNNIEFVHESEGKNQRLDFYLPAYNVYIEIKQYYSERTASQLELAENVILLQGKKAVQIFCSFINAFGFVNKTLK